MIKVAYSDRPNEIGRVGENDAIVMQFPVGDILAEHPEATFVLINKRPKDKEGYPVPGIVLNNGNVEWSVKSADLAQEGSGRCEIVAYEDEVIVKTLIYVTRILPALDGSGEAPDPWESWVTQVHEDAERADAAAELLKNCSAEAESLEPGTPATAEYRDGVFYFGIPNGDPHGLLNDEAGEGDTNQTWTADKLACVSAEKADKVTGATEGNFAGLDENGNLTDSGKDASDFIVVSQKGAANGVAELDSTGKVPEAQLPESGLTDTIAAAYITNVTKEIIMGIVSAYVAEADFTGYAIREGNVFPVVVKNEITLTRGSNIRSIWQLTMNINSTGEVSTYIDDRAFTSDDTLVIAPGVYWVRSEYVNDYPRYYLRTNGLSATKINGKTIGDAVTKDIDTTIEPDTTSENLPTSQAVENRISGIMSDKIDAAEKGEPGGVAELDVNGKVPASQLPSYVDDVLEYASILVFPATGETGKIYVALDTNKTYRWSGTGYVEISASLALGETSGTAYRGDRGKIAYDHAQAKGSAFISGFYKITTNSEGHVTSVSPVQKSDITALGIPGEIPEIATTAETEAIINEWEVSA